MSCPPIAARLRSLLTLSVLLAPVLATAPTSAQASAPARSYRATTEGLEARIGRGRYRGVVAVVERNGERVYETALGMRDAAGEEPMRGDEIFRGIGFGGNAFVVLMILTTKNNNRTFYRNWPIWQ